MHRLALVDLGCSLERVRRREGTAAAHIVVEEGEDLQEDPIPVAVGEMVEGRQVHQIAVVEGLEERSRLAGMVVEGTRRTLEDSHLEEVRMTLSMRIQDGCKVGVVQEKTVVGREYFVNDGAEATLC